jgi:hypothetical protein
MTPKETLANKIKDLTDEYRKQYPEHRFLLSYCEVARLDELPESIINSHKQEDLNDIPSVTVVLGNATFYQSIGMAYHLITKLEEFVDEKKNTVENPIRNVKMSQQAGKQQIQQMAANMTSQMPEIPEEIKELLLEFSNKAGDLLTEDISHQEKMNRLNELKKELIQQLKEKGFDATVLGMSNDDEDENDSSVSNSQINLKF